VWYSFLRPNFKTINLDLEKAYRLILQKLSLWTAGFVRMLPNLLLAALVIVLGFYVAKLARNLSVRLARRVTHHSAVNNLFSSFIYIVVVGVTFFVALSILQLDKAVTSILAGAGIAGIALAFAFQDIAANFMAGILIIVRRPFHIGDLIKTNDYYGKVITISLRDTVIKTFQGQHVIIPNKEIFSKPLENYSKSGRRRLDLTIGISYGEDLDIVKQITLEACKSVSVRDANEPVRMFYTEFADSSINYTLQVWLNSPDQPIFWQAQSEVIQAIKKAYDQHGITIPFPIRTLDFGIKGGQSLSDIAINLQHDKES
jgi:small conductance mechanosensitive channel